jgi:hypothetical protein
MINGIIDLLNCNSETSRKSEKALLILTDLFEMYNYVGERPTKQEADKLAYETERILSYINMASDYVFEIKKDLKQATENLDVLFDKAKHEKATPVKVKQIKEVKETDKDFMHYVYMRIEKALVENEEYKELQTKCVNADKNKDSNEYEDLTMQMAATEQELCYIQGYHDGMKLALSLQERN